MGELKNERYSAALCRGLIEIWESTSESRKARPGIPRLYAAASLKYFGTPDTTARHSRVFRGFMPRPH